MPIISGGIFEPSNENGLQALKVLLQLTREKLKRNIVELAQGDIAVLAGNEDEESLAEVVISFSNSNSLIAGRIFSRNADTFIFDAATDKHIEETKGKYLGEQLWGRYIYITYDRERKRITLFRDPQGLLTLFYYKFCGGYLFSTDISLIHDAVNVKPTLHWKYLTSFLVNAHNLTSSTAFENLYEVEPGCSVELSYNNASIAQFWDPTDLPVLYRNDEKAFQEELYQTFTNCTQAWATGADGVCVELSGGLDSSAVLAVLKDVIAQNTPISAINLFHPAIASSNEVVYAKNATAISNVPLKVLDWGAYLPFGSQKILKRYDRPSTFILDHELNKEMERQADFGARGEFMCGQGGDHLFLAPPLIECLADYIIERGFTGVTTKIRELCAYHRMPYFKVLGKTAQTLLNYARGSLDHMQLSLGYEPWMNKQFRSYVDLDIYKPFFWDRLKKVSPAKAQHILAMYSAIFFIDRGHRIAQRPIINPLLSQPLVELALSMPTYQTFANGYNRVQFRHAISKYKKGDYIWRKSKGETTGVTILAMRAHFDKLRELALEGEFAKKGLINRERMVEALNSVRHGKTESLWPVMNLIIAEMWLNSWK